MKEPFELIIDFYKIHHTIFLIGLIVILLCIIALAIVTITKKKRIKKKILLQLMELEAKKKETEKIASEKKIKEEIARKSKKKVEYKHKKVDYKALKEEALRSASISIENAMAILSMERPTLKVRQVLKAKEISSVNEPNVPHLINPKLVEDTKESSSVKEPNVHFKLTPKPVKEAKEIIAAVYKVKPTEILPTAKTEAKNEITENLFVNYLLQLPESIDNYAVIRIPKKGCIVRTHRSGNTKRRGFKEVSFQESIQKYFGSQFIISGQVRLNTGKETRPFEPDIALIDRKTEKNIRIDIEIDEPYAGISRQPTHCKGEDVMRDSYFVDRGWLVIRFSEFQVHTQEKECLKFIAFVLQAIDANYSIPHDLISTINFKGEKLWDVVQAQKWEKAKYREQYLNHHFIELPEEKETEERDFSEQEKNEEKLVKPSKIGIADKTEKIGFNKSNAHPRDNRIAFYPESHVYTIDNIPVPSASTVISKFFPEFDSYGKASSLSSKNPLFGLPVNEIVRIWKERGLEAANQGTYLHNQIEKYYLNQPYDETGEFHLFKQFVADHQNILPYRSEWRIFDEKKGIAGTIDLIASNGNYFEIYDWKRSKNVVDNAGNPINIDSWGSCGVGKLSVISNTSYNHYCLQQSLYRYILENNYGMKVSKMFLIVLYPDNNRYFKVETPYWKDRIEYILNTI